MIFQSPKIPRHLILSPKPKKRRLWPCVLGLPILILFALMLLAHSSRAETYQWQRPGAVEAGELLFKNDAGQEARALHLASDYQLQISGMVAQLRLRQRFRNQGQDWLEAVYVFPLQQQAAVQAMQIRIGERIIRGKIKEKQEAKRIYREAKAAGKRAALSSQQRPNMFTQKVANIGPGETIEVELTITQPVQMKALAEGGQEFSLRLPSTITPRFIPGQPLPQAEEISLGGQGWAQPTQAVADAHEITPPMTTKAMQMSLAIVLDAGLPLATIDSASHQITVQKQQGQHRVQLSQGMASMNRDFVLSWRPLASAEARAALFRQTLDQSDYAMLMLLPPAQAAAAMDREVIYIIDTSGSMGGESIRQAKAALELAIERLPVGHRFNIIEFNSVHNAFRPQTVVMDEHNRGDAVNFVRGLEAGGGTDMLPALKEALAQEPSPGFIKQVVFITDGSVGNEAQLFAEIHQRLGDARLFTVGIGSAPNGFFMRKAAQFGRGSYSYIGDIGQLKTEMAELFAKLERPVLRDIKVQWPKHLQVEMWPENIPDLYLGEPLRILAKLSDKNASDTMAGKIVIEGDLGGGRWRQSLDLAGAGQKQHPGVATLWGREKIEALLDQKIMGRDEALVRKDVLAVALRQQLLSPYTSFVAVEQKPARPAQQKLTSEAVPNAMPKGNTMAFPSTASLWQAQLLLALLPLLLLWRRRRV